MSRLWAYAEEMTVAEKAGAMRRVLLKRALPRLKKAHTPVEVDERNPYGSSHDTGWERQFGATYRGGQS
jgi:hypothetical protein